MIRFHFAKPPKVSIACYVLGFIMIAIAMVNQFASLGLMNPVLTQQVFLLGAIIVACGSVLNWLVPLLKRNEE
ncbi:hypothetical protein [Pleionea sp. CnH1-48]|uniref:hypothetical protein n=1 Tax=Pleionea sp. CnH1-48 TaxID=2954494 RepID=UPI0020972746|nr:hypothetical protein [Pleionea sp. CnH1-48]MCO7227048.1 hypothetical protein [Pleionea sp. CnH1-48]